ncbi:MBL fold metallo-hydrolase [Falsiroseomonas tokyonensis]|uniref:MBL fold metallo-hydrolase n=1 Tax=Falsiroseomonas tokyonensis TaxID=430521 RepID=A0ABV7BYB7_9PROT|nr:MBL fold metallo-hydrolase [Falsiroseomonas tokyonensis]MBU8540640.1 MBL fold metallo-hydrolase [Falsiroseomonas tokyonensis]
MISRRLVGFATLGLPLLATRQARAYRPGAGLEIVRLDRPGEASVNSYLLVGARSVVVLDCQRTAVEARAVVAAASGLGLPVEAIVLSHEHPDHIVGLDVVARAFPEAPIMAGEGTRDWIVREGPALLGAMRGAFGAAIPDRIPEPSRILRPGEMIRLAGTEWRVDQLGPGEASGMTVLHAETEDVLFAGDLFGSRATPWLLDGHARAWIAQLETALPRYGGIGTGLPGHGAAAPVAALIREQLGYLRAFESLVRTELAGGASLPEGAAARIRGATDARFPGYPRVAPQPNLIELNAQSFARELAGR